MSRGHHRVREVWLGEEVETLEDLLRPGLRVVCVGINPSPVSVASGHYYQGRLGKLFFSRLEAAGVIAGTPAGEEDDAAFEEGVGFTDIVKKPTARESQLTKADFEAGRAGLLEKLARNGPDLVIFTYKKTAKVLCGSFDGHGFVEGVEAGGAPAFVMPGPFEKSGLVSAALDELRHRAG